MQRIKWTPVLAVLSCAAAVPVGVLTEDAAISVPLALLWVVLGLISRGNE